MHEKINYLALPGSDLAELETERERLKKSAISKNTEKAYESDFVLFEKWCAQIRRPALPANDFIIDLYICYLNKLQRKPSTISRALTAINQKHLESGFNSPIGQGAKNRMSQVRRYQGAAAKKVSPITVEHLKKIIAFCPRDFLGIRDRALLLVGWTAALRRSSIAALNIEDLEERAEGIVLTLRESKTDQEKKGFKIGLPIVENEVLCPVRNLRKWLDLARITSGAVFRAVGKGGSNHFLHITGSRISDKTVSTIIKRRVKAAGYDPSNYSGHSLRAGMATSAAAAGIPERLIMKITGHTSEKTVREYIRDGGVFLEHPAIALLCY
jgi:integrase